MNRTFWLDTAERALYTMAETALGVLGSCALLEQVNWKVVVSASILSGIVTMLKCIVVKGGKNDQ